jgi:pilus assembly protein CpaC
VRAKTGNTIACFCALSFVLCAAPGLRAQASPPASQPATDTIQDSANDLYVAVGKTVLVDCAKPIKRVSIGLGDVAETHAISRTEIMVSGKAPGETSLIIWDILGGRQFFNVKVHPIATVSNDDLDAIRRELRAELPGQALKVTYENNTVFLRGTVKDLNSSNRAVKIASTGGKVLNLLNVSVPPADPQILLKVRFASVDLNKEKQLGMNIFSTGFGNTIGTISTGQFSPPTVSLPSAGTPATAALAGALQLVAFYPGLNLGATIEALQQHGVVEVLSEPNIMASNGKEASFLAGGEYPYPVVQGGSGGAGASVTIMFKEFGVRLNFIATVTPRGSIRLQVAPEVSTLDLTQGVTISGFDVPAIDTRKMSTEVELSDGQSFAIGGLLDKRDTETFQKIPFLGDIPILGKFFQSEQITKTNSELIVIVTPEIVAPIAVGETVPEPKFPGKFMPQNSNIPMNTPDAKNAANTPAPSPTVIPIEKLIESMKPETPLKIEGASGSLFGAASSSGGATTSAPPQ